MAITVPVPGLGDVIVLTSGGETAESSCTFPGSGAPALKEYQVEQGQLYIIGCNSFPLGGGTVAYILDAQNINIPDLINAILGLAIVQDSGGKVNRFTAI
ncbi:hypothetical protein MKX67_08740 [Cytobacillus sp. FSL W7-1323]|uniref:hypothetical protein n=1 Tax=Cytobacillus sp. FSL W7-1323 TaxID=2921700 RepID=UPI0031597AC0